MSILGSRTEKTTHSLELNRKLKVNSPFHIKKIVFWHRADFFLLLY